MQQPKLIVLNGFAGAGKSTIAQQYIADHPLALAIEGDELIVKLGHWLTHEERARGMVYEMTQSLAAAHLARGYDVVLPYLVADATHITVFEHIAQSQHARFFNILLDNEKDVAIAKLLERGSWGEAGTDPLSEKDTPEIIRLYDRMESELIKQNGIITISQSGRTIADTYAAVLQATE